MPTILDGGMGTLRELRIGIWGTGAIAGPFAQGASEAGAQVVAVGSRRLESARRFAASESIPRAYEGLPALLADPEVDLVYLASPNLAHEADALLAIGAGKAVLCEKPLSTSVASAERMIAAARSAGVFLMEAMWTRFFPAIARIEEVISGGSIGAIRLLEADFGFAGDRDAEPRTFDPKNAGALLDVGVYPLWLATHLFGDPREVVGSAIRGSTGADESAAAVLTHDGGVLSVITTSIVAETRSIATITGTVGRIEIASPWWRPSAITIQRSGQEPEPIALPYLGNGYAHEVIEVAECLRAGRLESPRHPLARTLSVLRLVERIRGP